MQVIKMDEEANLAKLDNAKLFQEFSRREETCNTLVKQQQISFEILMKNKVELEVVQASTQLQEILVNQLMKKAEEEEM